VGSGESFLRKMEYDSTKGSSSRKKDASSFHTSSNLGVHANLLDICIRIASKFLGQTSPFILDYERFRNLLRKRIISVYGLCTSVAFTSWNSSLLESSPALKKTNFAHISRGSQMKNAGERAYAIYQHSGKMLIESLTIVHKFPSFVTSGKSITNLMAKLPINREFLGMSIE